MQCSIRLKEDKWSSAGVQCPKEATTIVRFKGKVVSHRCDEHTVDRFLDSQHRVEPVSA